MGSSNEHSMLNFTPPPYCCSAACLLPVVTKETIKEHDCFCYTKMEQPIGRLNSATWVIIVVNATTSIDFVVMCL